MPPQDDILTVEERRKQNHDQMVSDILLIAREMMQADGVAALSFNAIARRLGMKPPSLYTYFASKHAIYDALFRFGYEEFARYMETHAEPDKGLEALLRSVVESYMSFGLENPDLFQIMFQRPIPGFEPSEASMEVSLNGLNRMQVVLQEVLEKSGLETTTSIEETRDLIIALTHGLTALQLANNPDLPIGEGRFGALVESAVELLMQAWNK